MGQEKLDNDLENIRNDAIEMCMKDLVVKMIDLFYKIEIYFSNILKGIGKY